MPVFEITISHYDADGSITTTVKARDRKHAEQIASNMLEPQAIDVDIAHVGDDQ